MIHNYMCIEVLYDVVYLQPLKNQFKVLLIGQIK